MLWFVSLSKKVQKKIDLLPTTVRRSLVALVKDIETYGPIRGNWPNYGMIGRNLHHCHLKKGKPTYVAVWEVKDKTARFVEVIYAGSHEKAPY